VPAFPCFQKARYSRAGNESSHIAAIPALAVVRETAEPVPSETTVLGLGAAGKRIVASLMAMGAGLLYPRPPSWNVPAPWMWCAVKAWECPCHMYSDSSRRTISWIEKTSDDDIVIIDASQIVDIRIDARLRQRFVLLV